MAGPIALAVAKARLVSIRCPHCGLVKLVERKPAEFRVCPTCRRQFADPLKR